MGGKMRTEREHRLRGEVQHWIELPLPRPVLQDQILGRGQPLRAGPLERGPGLLGPPGKGLGQTAASCKGDRLQLRSRDEVQPAAAPRAQLTPPHPAPRRQRAAADQAGRLADSDQLRFRFHPFVLHRKNVGRSDGMGGSGDLPSPRSALRPQSRSWQWELVPVQGQGGVAGDDLEVRVLLQNW